MASELIVIHFNGGKVKKGTTSNFSPDRNSFTLKTINDEQEEVNIVGIKSIFFVKDLDGEKNFSYEYKDNVSDAGKKVQVEFKDGETIIGYVFGYSPMRQGFEMIPADLEGNNLRIYAVAAAVKKVQFLEASKFKLL